MKTVDLNADMGESFGPWTMGDDAAVLNIVTSANIACGGHAGDADVMAATMTLAHKNGVGIGAHPGFDVLSQPLQATAIYCGLNWLPPFAMHCTFICDDETLEGQARHYKQRLLEWQEAHHG